MIQEGTFLRGVSCLIFLVTLICSSMASWEEVPSQDILDLGSLEIGQDTAEPQLINCRSGLIIKDLNLCFSQKVSSGSSNSFSYECVSFSKGDIGEFVHALHPDLKQSVVDCLRRNGLTFHVSGEETVSKHWYSQYLKSTPSSLNTHRRFLATQSPAAAPGPAVSSGPDTSSSPSPSGTLDSGSSPPAPPPKVSFFPPFNAPSPQALLSQSNSSASLSSNDQASKGNSNRRAVVIAVAVTAPITFLLAALLFLCYNKYRSRIRAGRNDDRPLLSMSDYSVGSSYKPYGLGSSIKEEKPKDNFPAKASAGGGTDGRIHTSTGGGMGDMGGGMHASLVWETFESPHANSGNGVFSPFPPLKPPPGRAAANSNFLKPPAGRADPLPPERPAPPKLPAKTRRRPPPPPSAPKPAPLSVVTKLPPGQPAVHSVSKPGGPPPAPSGLKPSGPPSQLPVPSGPKSGASPPPPSPAPSGSKPGAPPPPPPPAPSGPKPGAPPPPPPPAPSGPKPGAPPPRPPPAPSGPKLGAPPPLPPKSGPSAVRPPPHPPGAGPKINRPPPLAPKGPGGGVALDEEANAPKTKLKPFFWDKVLANPDQSMVWHHIKSGSFQFNEETIETLFGFALPDKGKKENKESTSQDYATHFVHIIDTKKAQNLLILLRALNMTIEEVRDALHEGNELPTEFLQSLLKMTPTADEELKLRVFSGELSELSPADRFLKTLIDIPFVFKRMEVLLLMSTLQEEVTSTKESFETLEVACKELRNSRLFLKLLEAVLKTGNRMNDGTFRGGAQAFKLNTLLKLSDVKGTDGKTTLLHFVVQEIVRSEGVRAARAARESQNISGVKSDNLLENVPHETEEYHRSLGLEAVSGLGGELRNVKKAATIDSDILTGSVAKLGHALVKTQNFLNTDMKNLDEESGFHQTLKSFVQNAEIDVTWLLEEEKRIMALVKSTGNYFHGKAGKDEGLRVFVIVRDFLIMLDKVCKEVKDLPPPRPVKQQKKDAGPSVTSPASSDPRQPASPDLRQRLFPAIQDRRMNDSSSDDES